MKNMLATLLAGAMMLTAATLPVSAATVGEDGLHKQEWFALTFKDINEDIAAATEAGKRLVLIFEQRGCIYCQEVHENLLSDPMIRDYIKENFMVVQYNLHGDEEVTDTDGDVLTEKTAARKWGLLFTPTFLFMPEEPAEGADAVRSAVAVMPGAFKKKTFTEMFIWVRNKGYEKDEGFQTYYNRRFNAGVAGDPDAPDPAE